MVYQKKNEFMKYVSLSGAAGVAFYLGHVIIGGLLWDGYSHITQTISELTSDGAPNGLFLRTLTSIYGILVVMFSLFLFRTMKKYNFHKLAKFGALSLVIMEITSFFGYLLFPLDPSSSLNSMQNLMHVIVTAIVVIFTLISVYCIGFGLKKSTEHKYIGSFSLLCALVITLTGFLTPVAMANDIQFTGLLERINIFSIQIWILILSVYFYSYTKKLYQK